MMRSLQVTTAVGAVSLTLAGWGWMSQVEASNAAQLAEDAATKLALTDTAMSVPIANRAATLALPQASTGATRQSAPTSTTVAPTVIAPTPTATPDAGTASATTQTVKLDIVQWVKTNAGDPVAIVRDARGVLWYVWGDDVPRIEQGQTPQYQPQPVNARGRSRHS
ncbi:MAG: hypothetical protein H6644_05795 [Caldilineaceae bacterium]|nr:hypothetical protein [Caldilineaceae bacterium]